MGYPRGVQGSTPWPPLVRKLGASNVGLPWVLRDAIAVVGLLAFVCCLLFVVCCSLLSFVVCLESRLRDDFFKSEAGAQRCHAMTVVLVDALYLAKVNELRPRAFVQGLPTWGARFNSLAATCAEAWCFECGFAVGATRCSADLFVGLFCTAFDPGAVAREFAYGRPSRRMRGLWTWIGGGCGCCFVCCRRCVFVRLWFMFIVGWCPRRSSQVMRWFDAIGVSRDSRCHLDHQNRKERSQYCLARVAPSSLGSSQLRAVRCSNKSNWGRPGCHGVTRLRTWRKHLQGCLHQVCYGWFQT